MRANSGGSSHSPPVHSQPRISRCISSMSRWCGLGPLAWVVDPNLLGCEELFGRKLVVRIGAVGLAPAEAEDTTPILVRRQEQVFLVDVRPGEPARVRDAAPDAGLR